MKRRQNRNRKAARAGSAGVQYTVRNVPPHTDRALRRKAREENKSLNDVLREALIKEGSEGVPESRVYHDLDHLAGTWQEDPDFDAALAAQDQVDAGLWR